jgi:hypothetical protein
VLIASAFVRAASALAAVGAAHSALNAVLLRRAAVDPPPVAEPVSVLIPARDEAGHIGPCLDHVLAQQDVAALDVVVYDDGSTDGTADLARERSVRVLTGGDLPAGWLGKPHACQRLAEAADPRSRILIFLDADVRLRPTAVAAAVDAARRWSFDLVSMYPRLEAVTIAERLVQPLLPWSWMTFLPLRAAENSPRPSLTAAGGQFLAVRRSGYDLVGGHAAVRGEVLEDMALARIMKSAGGRVGLVDASEVASCRMYAGWGELRDGYQKSLGAAFGSPVGAALAMVGLGAVYVVPAIAAAAGIRAGLTGYAAAAAGRVVCGWRTGSRWWPDALAHPASVAALIGLTGRSALARRSGRAQWKGRAVSGPAAL